MVWGTRSLRCLGVAHVECGGTVECVRLGSGGARWAEAVIRGVTDTEVSTAELELGRVQGFSVRLGEPQCLVVTQVIPPTAHTVQPNSVDQSSCDPVPCGPGTCGVLLWWAQLGDRQTAAHGGPASSLSLAGVERGGQTSSWGPLFAWPVLGPECGLSFLWISGLAQMRLDQMMAKVASIPRGPVPTRPLLRDNSARLARCWSCL